jgi:tRNA pseudouridine55 synthase
MAEGVLLVGSGTDTSQKRREEFFNLDKEYDFVVLFGFATDTYDILGKIVKSEDVSEINELDLIKLAKLYEGKREQKYPEYSSKMISLRNKKAPPLTPPQRVGEKEENIDYASDSLPLGEGKGGASKKIAIHHLQFQKLETLSKKELFGKLLMDISKVRGDFRQAEILELWKDALLPSPSQGEGQGVRSRESNHSYIAKFSAHVSSGTYIRSLVSDLGNTLGIPATCFSIKRTRVGDYKIENSLKF